MEFIIGGVYTAVILMIGFVLGQISSNNEKRG